MTGRSPARRRRSSSSGIRDASDRLSSGAAAFNGFDGDLGGGPYGDIVAGYARTQITLVIVAAAGRRAVRSPGHDRQQQHRLRTRVHAARLLLDADKKCDLALDVPTPLELMFVGRKGTAAQISVENKGERPCGGR